MDVAVLVIVSCGARRVELACAGPPHCRGSLPFSGANAVSAHSTRRACLCFTIFSSLPNFSAHRLPCITFHPYLLTTLILHSLTHSHTSLLASRSCLFFFCLFSLSDGNGISYRENVLSGTGGLWKHVLYEENVLGGTKSVCKGIWSRLKRLFGTKWTS